ncbi:MAG: maltose alpha-D-glucosyltransferase [Chlamydiota bacterium]|nr:maltose alpha-D-glucosyltransferase [Chlamydiota bacterium]
MTKESLWYKNAIFYQINVKCFQDSNDDGIGDFKGLTQKLDYIQTLGCTAIWLQPFYPSPLKDDGYDIADYMNIHPDYGSISDFKKFLKEAHKRNIKVVTELVINHTSDQHQWFQRSRNAKKNSKWRNYYVWSDTPDLYPEARIIFKDFENSNWAWDPVAKAYYWHRFYSSQPDLNYDNPDVHKEIFKIADFWFDMGVDGVRLDAIPYLYQREGSECENLPETHAFLRKLRAHVDSKYENRMLLAEANQWPEQASAYFGEENECHMAFHFPVMPRLFMALQMEDKFPITDIMEQTPTAPETCQWAMFLRNHDELTLEMVTDEERDFMYRMYAKDPKARINLGIRRRLAPLLENDRFKIELLNVLLFSLPGSPIIYYGDEIGMGDNYYLGDRNGVRTPMQWNTHTNAGFSEANPQQLYLPLIIDPEYHHAYLNVKNQERTSSSLLRWMRGIIAIRQQYDVFGFGEIKFLSGSNSRVLLFLRKYRDESILVVANLSRHSQYVEVMLDEYVGSKPIDLFSQNEFAEVKDSPYGITLGRYGYYWFGLGRAAAQESHKDEKGFQELSVSENWMDVFSKSNKKMLTKKILPEFIAQSRWFKNKTKSISQIQIQHVTTIAETELLSLNVIFRDESFDKYFLPVCFISLEEGLNLYSHYPKAFICRLKVDDEEGFLIDSTYDKKFHAKLYEKLIKRHRISSGDTLVQFNSSKSLKGLTVETESGLQTETLKAEQSNTSINFNDKFIVKIFREICEGTNPDLEISKYLTDDAHFHNTPKLMGSIEQKIKSKVHTFAIAQEFVPNSGDAWSYSLNALDLYFQEAISKVESIRSYINKKPSTDIFTHNHIPEEFKQLIGYLYSEIVSTLGVRTGELHLALAKAPKKYSDIHPEPFSIFFQKSLYQKMRSQLKKTFTILREKTHLLDENTRLLSQKVLAEENNILKFFKKITENKYDINKIRIHGDYHLGQVLVSGNDVSIIDFEGEPLLTLSERRLKRCALQDVAGLIRSFHYASLMALQEQKILRPHQEELLESVAEFWYKTVSKIFFSSYSTTVGGKYGLLPEKIEDSRVMLNIYLLHKAIYEMGYELNSRPEWLNIPIKGILMLLEEINNG